MSSRRPSSPLSPSHSRHASIGSQFAQHAPITPSTLRESHTVASSPDDTRDMTGEGADMEGRSSTEPSPTTLPTHLEEEPEEGLALDGKAREEGEESFASRAVNETTALLRKPFEFVTGSPHAGPCNHGTFSPGLESRADSIRSGHSGVGFGVLTRGERPNSAEGSRSLLGSMFDNFGVKSGNGKKKMSTTSYLAERHGIKNTTTMYVWNSGGTLTSTNGADLQVYSLLHTLRRLD